MEPRNELGRRIKAAMTLAGVTQTELGRRMAEDGLKLRDPEEIMQGRKTAQRAHFDSLARHLGVPPEWFTAEDFAAWIARASEQPEWQDDLVKEFRNRHAELLATISRLRTEQEQQRSLLERVADGREGRGNA